MDRLTNFTPLKAKQQAAWASGDYAVIGTTLQIVGERLAEACDLRWDERVLDVAAGTPTGFIGRIFKVLGKHLPPPAGTRPPSLWGDAEHLRALFGDAAGEVRTRLETFAFRYRSPAHFIDVFRTWYGPVHKAFAALDADQGAALERDLGELLGELNTAGPDSLVIHGEYLEAVIVRA